MDAQFLNYARHSFGWTPNQAAPVMVAVGLCLAAAPKLLVARLGVRRSIIYGTLVCAVGQAGSAFSPTATSFVISVFVAAVGFACIPALVGLLTSHAGEAERGALIGGLGSVQKLCSAVGNAGYSRIFAYSISEAAPFKLPGAHFLVSALLLLAAHLTALARL